MFKLPTIIYTLFVATFLERFSYFLIIPFLSIYLSKNFEYSGFKIGIVISMFAITALFMSFIAAPYIDRVNKKVIIYLGLFLSTSSFFSFSFINNFLGFVIFSIINSTGNSLLSPTYKTLIANYSSESKKHIIFNIRYYIINISSTLAPLLSTQLQKLGVHIICNMIVLAYFINASIFSYTFFKGNNNMKNTNTKRKSPFLNYFSIFYKNKTFLFLVIGQILFVFGYTLMSSILPQYFAINKTESEASELFGFLLSINGITVITCQYLVFKFSKITSITYSITVGAILLPIGLFLLGTLDNIILLSVAMIIFTLGEMLVYTMIDIRIDEISEPQHKGSYYSLSGLQNIGSLLAPLIGGILLDHINNGILLFSILSIISVMSVIFFKISHRSNKVFNIL